MCLSRHTAKTSCDEMVNLGGEILGQKNIQQSTLKMCRFSGFSIKPIKKETQFDDSELVWDHGSCWLFNSWYVNSCLQTSFSLKLYGRRPNEMHPYLD